jgi:type IV pilus assembly protein PilW
MMKKYVMEITNKGGYTIVELLVGIAISGIFLTAIYSAYFTQQRSTLAQEQVSAMQRNLRSAMYFMEKEIRMAGCDPTGKAGARIETAQNNGIRFTLDVTDDAGTGEPDGDVGDANEDITYSLPGADLLRNGARIAENIDAINFVYLDRDGARLDDGSGNVIYDDSKAEIRSIQVTVVARTGKEDPHYSDSTTYKNKLDEPIFTPAGNAVHFRRKVLRTSIKCRNLGL